MFPPQYAAEAMAAHAGHKWADLRPDTKERWLAFADAACKGIVDGDDGWRIVRTERLPEGYAVVDARDEVVEIAKEWKP